MLNKRHLLKLAATALLAAAMPALAGDYVAPPEGHVAVHYQRPDGKYDNWGLHIWKSPNIGLVGWGSPMMPTGTDDFGPYWHLKLSDFGSSGQVNYIIHKGDSKDQNGKDMSFDGKANKEVWIISGDVKIYPSKAEALAAVKK
ncbi:pullulanase-associated domain-containing protein [Parachitinimonas caeni]|uniref:Pullulanase-associated domain-containing protein n=1 Tax=Parachitinimonas caeni TaxID=3031301 RepID=A0ABT7DV71_9NEIS|nr:pullulanase-associated domain-containing protein [Parachitinimonas caeni]MDK2123943.1 pullulanase-associated domain-containing protein [Parachitinimonas caeni]